MRQILRVCFLCLCLTSPFSLYASDISEGEISPFEVEAEESLHEQSESRRERDDQARVESEIRREAELEIPDGVQVDQETSNEQGHGSVKEEKEASPETDVVDEAADDAAHRRDSVYVSPDDMGGDYEPVE